MNALNINSSNSPTVQSSYDQPTWLTQAYLCLVYMLNLLLIWCHPSSTICIFLPYYKSPTALLDMHHFTCGISSLLHSVNLILFTVLLAHLILCISPHHSHHLRSHHPSLTQSFTPDLKLISFTNPFCHRLLILPDCLHVSLTCTELTGHWRFLFWFPVLD